MDLDAFAAIATAFRASHAKIDQADRRGAKIEAAAKELKDDALGQLFRLSPWTVITHASISGSDAASYWLDRWKKQERGPCTPAPQPDLERAHKLIPHSWYLQFEFALERPVSTADEDALGPTDNMFRKERATGVPFLAASSWKGALFAAYRQLFPNCLESEEGRKDVAYLFGRHEAQSENQDHRRGALQFYSSHFDQLGLYALHPLSRDKKDGTPVLYEVVPEKSKAWFSLLWLPMPEFLDMGADALQSLRKRHARRIGDAVATMLLQTGFGGKTSSGFGQATDLLISKAQVVGFADFPKVYPQISQLGELKL